MLGPWAGFPRVRINGTGQSSLQPMVLVAGADRLGSSPRSGPLGRGDEENICLASGLQEAHSLLPPQAELSVGPVPGVECPCTYLG